jgi:hypothetical protein
MLNYSITENPLKPGTLIAVPYNVRTYVLDEIIKRIIDREPGINSSQLKAALEEFFKEVCFIIEDGGAVNTPLVNTYPSIVGGFKSATDTLNQKRNRIKTNFSAGKQVRKATKNIKAQKGETVGTLPRIFEVQDENESVNEFVTIGGTIQILGHRLKLFTINPDNGVFFVNEQTGAAEKVKRIMKNLPKSLIAKVPANLEPDAAYKIEVRTSFLSAEKETKTVKIGRFDRELIACIDADGVNDVSGDNSNSDENE